MDNWDWVLVVWWPLAIVLGASAAYFVRRGRRAEKREALSVSLQNSAIRTGPQSPDRPLPPPLAILYLLLWVALVIGFIALLWAGYANPRTMENMYAFNILFGVLFIVIGLSSSILSNVKIAWIRTSAFILRPIVVLAGVGMIGYSGYMIFEDLTKPHAIVEGRVTRFMTDFGRPRGARHLAFIGGQPFLVTEDVRSNLKVGQRVRAELTAGSNVIVLVAVLAPPPPRASAKPQ